MKIETLNSLWYNSFTTKPIPPEISRKEYKISWIILYQFGALNATLIHFINTAKINLAIKSINAVNVNISLHPILFQVVQEVQNHFRRNRENILPVPFAVSPHFFITITMIIPIIAALIKNAIINSFKQNLL